MNLVFRLDAAVAIGSGHLMRCLALADSLRERGAQVTFIMYCDIAALLATVTAHGHQYRLLPVPASDWQADAMQTKAVLDDLPPQDCLIVDNYQLDAHWESAMRPRVGRIMVIDDLADRPHDCDMLLDQNFNLNPELRYQQLVAPQCRQLLGPQYAMLRPEFIVERSQLRQRDGSVLRLAVFFGGTDPGGATMQVLEAIAVLPNADIQWQCDVIIGAANPLRAQIEQMCHEHLNWHFYCQTDHMAQLMAATDLCLGAGGTALWERAVLGVPSLVMTVADNQEPATQAMARAGALIYLGRMEQTSSAALQQALAFILANPWLLQSLSQRSLEMMDGQGLARVTDHIVALCRPV